MLCATLHLAVFEYISFLLIKKKRFLFLNFLFAVNVFKWRIPVLDFYGLDCLELCFCYLFVSIGVRKNLCINAKILDLFFFYKHLPLHMFVWGWVGSLCMHTCMRILTLYIASNLACFLSEIKHMV